MGCGGKPWSLVLAQLRSSPLTVSCSGSQDVELGEVRLGRLRAHTAGRSHHPPLSLLGMQVEPPFCGALPSPSLCPEQPQQQHPGPSDQLLLCP